MTSPTGEDSSNVGRIALRLPLFWRNNVALWNRQCDSAFVLSQITQDETKYAALVSMLDPETLSHASDIILSPPAENKYAAHIQAPLHEFLKNSKRNDKREVEWNAEAINAFNQCKNQLANVTLLAHPSQDADLALMTDASDFGLGASLNEITSHGFKPLGFFSKKLAPAKY
ncbi:uncharacterized protein TNIN_268131 [Trichonephila inaurata madagascariensis]|uniref:Reverse transcriptase/retrotransposon-derived protein RNase H-like domain-containing protein n=1 Tax=Trichonephila inaurata madagascariensis TaxID=2747483 RepID=A0A8X6YIF0_9ARAC|nr:uncharacterized protein TNIN_32581 [Trichonephila inaurata madagascariensis]GFY70124.1 uncharacterized protein TNIN_268131 [Trichonephila inaurata madagascariensis]